MTKNSQDIITTTAAATIIISNNYVRNKHDEERRSFSRLKISSRGNLVSRRRDRNLFDAFPSLILEYISGSRIIINYPCAKSTLARIARVSNISRSR